MSSEETATQDEWAALAALQRRLQALDRGETPDIDGPIASRAVRTRVIRRVIAERKAAERAEVARRGLRVLQRRMDQIVADAREAGRRSWVRIAPSFERERRSGIDVFWSPAPVLAYRAWAVRGLLRGVIGVWQEPVYRAGCMGSGGERRDPSVPHTDGSCGSPPCGIYATKTPEVLVDEIGLSLTSPGRVAFGVVELTGKVVEHTHGYRASHARVVALAVVGGGNLVCVEGERRLRRLFAAPDATLVDIERDDPESVEELERRAASARVVEYLEQTRLLVEATRSERAE